MKKLLLFVFIAGISAALGLYFLTMIKSNTKGNTPIEVKLREGDNWEEVFQQLTADAKIKHPSLLQPVAKALKYDTNIKPGRYLIEPGTSTFGIIRKLRSGVQDPVNLTLNNITFDHQLAEKVAKKLDIDENELLEKLRDAETAEKFGFNTENFRAMFLCNTYSFFWDTNTDAFIYRMFEENLRFWNYTRKGKAEKLGLTPIEIVVLASIVQKETNHKPEYSRVAGVYLNRLNKGIALQADPTVKFALGDMGLRRILKKDLAFDSPYNTYANRGLPPGPICLPEKDVIDGVLDAEEHNYLYFCAVFGSGKHAFASTYDEHLKNAREYQKALNQEKIFR